MKHLTEVKFTFIAILAFTALFSFLLLKFRSNEAFQTCLITGGLMAFNFAALSLLWKIIFNKKSIALAVFVIIFKYVFLGLFLWYLSRDIQVDAMGLTLGLFSLVISILSTGLMKRFLKN